MRKSLLGFAASLALSANAGAAQGGNAWYYGAKAEQFIAKYLPHAWIPGEINQAFAYGPHLRGWASCNVPAMGARSDGAVSVCYVKF